MQTEVATSKVLLVSCYELGHQPISIATPLAYLHRAGVEATAHDLSVQNISDDKIRSAEVIAVSVPMHTALKLGLRFAARVRALSPGCRLAFFGPYATLNSELLLDSAADAVFGGECDEALATWIQGALNTARTIPWAPPPYLAKLDYPPPARDGLPSIEHYIHLELDDEPHRQVGTVEASRGCRHHCRHCPLPPVYEGRFFVVPHETVLTDIDSLVRAGAEHINFADPDFLNGPRHALEIVRAMSARHPQLTFDFTAKVEHLLKQRDHLPELSERGCAFIVSAVESLSERVLRHLDKGHSASEAREAVALTRQAGIPLKPTFVAFTPWTTRDDYRQLFQWVIDDELIDDIEPIQMALRLLVPPGSLLAEHPGFTPYRGELDRSALTYRWHHPDPAMDELQRQAMQLVESGTRHESAPRQVFEALAALVSVSVPAKKKRRASPRLSEAWFC